MISWAKVIVGTVEKRDKTTGLGVTAFEQVPVSTTSKYDLSDFFDEEDEQDEETGVEQTARVGIGG